MEAGGGQCLFILPQGGKYTMCNNVTWFGSNQMRKNCQHSKPMLQATRKIVTAFFYLYLKLPEEIALTVQKLTIKKKKKHPASHENIFTARQQAKTRLNRKVRIRKVMEHIQENLVNVFCNIYKLWWRVICSEERKKVVNKYVLKGI